jgi:hypothetical protein
MIQFYQKGVVRDAGSGADVWIDEMCAQLAEDLLADKIGVMGPRGVDPSDGSAGSAGNKEGRIPLYNRYTYLPLVTKSGFDIFDYSTVYAFGAWAARNYGGAEFLRNVVQNAYTDKQAVVSAAKLGGAERSDLDSLIARWAVSVLGSDRTDMPPGYAYNVGAWINSAAQDGSAYRLGSMNIHNYLPLDPYTGTYGAVSGPLYADASGGVSFFGASSNVYYAAARSLSGEKSFEVTLPEGVTMHVVLK